MKMTLKDYYSGLPKSTFDPKNQFRNQVINSCNISKKTFYNWLVEEDKIPEWAKSKIEEIKKSINFKMKI